MKIYALALAILIFSGMVSLFNELDVFGQKVYEPGYAVNQSQVDGIYEIDQTTDTVDTKEGWTDKFADLIGFEWVVKMARVVWNTLALALNLGGLVAEYIPGNVGLELGALITAVTYFVYGWGGIQLYRKVSSKGMD